MRSREKLFGRYSNLRSQGKSLVFRKNKTKFWRRVSQMFQRIYEECACSDSEGEDDSEGEGEDETTGRQGDTRMKIQS